MNTTMLNKLPNAIYFAISEYLRINCLEVNLSVSTFYSLPSFLMHQFVRILPFRRFHLDSLVLLSRLDIPAGLAHPMVKMIK